jgi:EAL domain-containing protein (putative c-di-GMP-specific phosphodiesterase class I)
VEALLRWQHPLRGLVPPGEFIPLAESTDLILPIGLWVLQSACAQLKRWEYLPCCAGLQVSVNVSVRQFQQPDFVSQVQDALQASGAKPARLKLELTESLVLENMDDVVAKMLQIRQLGVRFSMDDFGTGYSSLAYLAQLPIDQLKIDKSFVQNIPGKSSDEFIARTIISMGLGLGMHVIAEGVETAEQHAFLAHHGCHAYQGYLFSRPLPAQALEAYMSQVQAPQPVAG